MGHYLVNMSWVKHPKVQISILFVISVGSGLVLCGFSPDCSHIRKWYLKPSLGQLNPLSVRRNRQNLSVPMNLRTFTLG